MTLLSMTEHIPVRNYEDIVEETHIWNKGITLIMGDYILSQIHENKLYKKGTMKVRCFPGAKFDDFYHYAIPLINKNPDRIVLHMGTNRENGCPPCEIIQPIRKSL